MKRIGILTMALMFLTATAQFVQASPDDYGSPKGSPAASPKGSPAGAAMVSDEAVKDAIKQFVDDGVARTGSFNLMEEETRKTRKLSFKEFHKSVKRDGDIYTMCVDFQDLDSGEIIDVDFDVHNVGGEAKVTDTRFHKVIEKGSKKGSDMESMEEHKGSDHDHKGSMKGSGY